MNKAARGSGFVGVSGKAYVGRLGLLSAFSCVL